MCRHCGSMIMPARSTTHHRMSEPSHFYTRQEIAERHGGSTIEYLPCVNGSIVCACLRTDRAFNPKAPCVILPGRGGRRESLAAVLCAQAGCIPIYLRRGPHRWEYVGDYEVESNSQRPADLAEYARLTGRPVTRVIRMRVRLSHRIGNG